MKFIYPNNKLEKAASKDVSRYAIQNVFLDVENARAIATDGHILTVHPVMIESGDTTGWLTRESLEAYRKASKRFDRGLKALSDVLVVTDANGAETRFPRPKYEPGSFPNYAAVMPKLDQIANKPTLTVDYELLKRLVESVGLADNKNMVAFFASDNQHPHIVKTSADGAIGIIMPLREDKNAPSWKLTLEELQPAIAEETAAA